MKNFPKRPKNPNGNLVLTRETIATLRPLDSQELGQVAGGTRTRTTLRSTTISM